MSMRGTTKAGATPSVIVMKDGLLVSVEELREFLSLTFLKTKLREQYADWNWD
jgi:hypothetical protein